jgi:hypothetical protein
MSEDVFLIEYKMNQLTYDALVQAHQYLTDGRAFLAREKLEEILGLNSPKE